MSELLRSTDNALLPSAVLAGQLDLAEAWARVAEKAGMPGVDGLSVSRFRIDATGRILSLQRRLADDSYRCLPLRLVEMQKKAGNSWRLLLVPAVGDRVALAAVAQWLNRKWNPLFDPCSFAYRPGLGVRDALRRLATYRDAGFRWVFDADIHSFFDSIPHARLLERLGNWLGSGSAFLSWIRGWVKAPVWDGRRVSTLQQGVPQGSPLSPILANFYLHEFDVGLRKAGIRFIRYADDFVLVAREPFQLQQCGEKAAELLSGLGLELNPEKTRTASFERWFKFLGAEMQGDSILVPFERKKRRETAVHVSPRMPRALLRAFAAGRLKASKEFNWSGPTSPDPGMPRQELAAEGALREPALERLALRPASRSLTLLREGIK